MKTRMFIALAGSSVFALASAAHAQSAPSQNEGTGISTIGEVVVTARRRTELLQDVPLTVNAVSSETLNKLNVRRFEELQSLVPGLNMSNNANGIGAIASVRGINFDVNVSGNNGTVEFYYNDAPISAGNLFQAIFDIGQVELLRGPQGTLRGRASPSGSMTVTTHAPNLGEAGGYVSVTGTDIGGANVQGAINLPIIKDMLALRVAGVLDETKGNLVRSINSPFGPRIKARGSRISLRFEPTQDLKINASWQQINQRLRTFTQVESANIADPTLPASPAFIDANDRASVQDTPSRTRQRFDNYNLQAQYTFAGQRLNYVGAKNRQVFSNNGVADVGDFFPATFPSFLNQGFGQYSFTKSVDKVHEIRLSSDERVFGMFDYIVGAFYRKTNVGTNLFSRTVVLFGPPSPVTPGTIVNTPILRPSGTKEQSVFANLNLHLGEATELSGGVRYIEYKNHGFLSVGGNVIPATVENNKDDTVIYQVSAKHRWNEQLMTYATLGTSWRPAPIAIGDFSIAPSARERGFTRADPEKSKSYEIGFKSDFFEKRLRLNVDAFHQTFKNYPYRSSSGVFYVETAANTATTPPTIFQRVSRFNFIAGVPVKVNGIEAEASFQAMDNWVVGGNASYAKSKIKNGIAACNDYLPADGRPDTGSAIPTVAQIQAATGGNTVAQCPVSFRASLAPLWTAVLNSEYTIPMGAMDGYVRGLLSLYGKSQTDPANPLDNVDGYALLNLYAGIRDHTGAWEVSLYGKNITNTRKVLTRRATPATTNYNIISTAQSGVTTYRELQLDSGVAMTAPREFGVNVRYAFGSR